jgi:hypothetical protein
MADNNTSVRKADKDSWGIFTQYKKYCRHSVPWRESDNDSKTLREGMSDKYFMADSRKRPLVGTRKMAETVF